jgi:hypothetical protein
MGTKSIIFCRIETRVAVSETAGAMKIVNLNQYRKRRRRSEVERRAAANRVSFGRTKAERSKDLSYSERVTKELEGKRLD